MREAIVIDPGVGTSNEARLLKNYIDSENLRVKYVINTHGHIDHTSGNGVVKEMTGAPIMIHEKDAPLLGELGGKIAELFGIKCSSPKADGYLKEGDIISFGEHTLTVMHTPGHSLGGISLVGKKLVFTGDTLFAGSVGRTDLPGGSYKSLMKSLKEKIMLLPDDFAIYPGHGPSSTIGEERRSNPFLQASPPMLESWEE
jgi:glyoxylase-like metal-dependent hydrolase (beta-lactamase superfamily II)